MEQNLDKTGQIVDVLRQELADGIYPVGEELVVFRNVSDQSPFLEHRLTREAGA